MPISAAQKSAIEEVLGALTSATGNPRKRQLAGMFRELVDRHDWPEYYEVIPEPRCLNNIQAMLEKNRYKDPLDAYTDLSLVFLNALFYNEPDSQIAMDAQTLKDLLDSEWKSKSLPTPRDSLPPSSAQKVHEPKPKPAPKPSTPATAPPKALPPVTFPAVNVPTSNFVYSKPTPLNPEPAPVVERTPVPDYSDSDSDSELDEDAYEPPAGAPTDIEIVRRLERALPRYAPLLGEEGGWMADVKQERHLEIVQAVKAYRDAANVKLSTALDGMPISFRLLESRSRSKTFYTASHPFDSDLARMFECGRRYYVERAGTVAGVGGEEWGRVVALQRISHALTSPAPPSMPLAQPLPLPSPPRTPGTHALERVVHKGMTLCVGNCVHVSSGADGGGDADQPQGLGLGRPGRPLVGRITACWQTVNRDEGVTVRWYLRAEEIPHLMPTTPVAGALVQTDKTTHHFLADVLERVAVQHTSSAPRGRPRAPAWYPGWPLYVCSHRYDAARGVVRRIHRAEWFESGVAEELDVFERPVRLSGGQATRPGVLVDRSVVSAGGLAVSAMEKLSAETTKHFERDPQTGEVLWFPGPPMHVARAPPPRHRLEYLHFLAKKYNPDFPEPPEPEVNGVTNGNKNGDAGDVPMGSDEEAARRAQAGEADVEMGSPPPAKRRRMGSEAEQRYLSASEMLREALSSGTEVP
ncbi:hypothetical protein C8J57DRAFT_1720338 [Mycena rebaudengoi]|nr:hypothetical protein C8J57DRAFT_1720338 [Mycena rebaudengoi]